MKTLKFKLYQYKRNRFIKRSIHAVRPIYSHCIAHKRDSRMWCQHLNCAKVQFFIAQIRQQNLFSQLVTQAVQDICQPIEKADGLLLKHNKKGVRPPNSKKVRQYKSFTLKQADYKFIGENRIKNRSRVCQDWNFREIEEKVKNLTIKLTLSELFMVVVIEEFAWSEIKYKTSKLPGLDFGLKVFLTVSDGTKIASPQFLKQSLTVINQASCKHSLNQVKDSANREKAKKNLVRRYEEIVNRRYDWFGKHAHDLTKKRDTSPWL
ncbi:transposase [Microcoleus sp. A2-C5]|uniref:transposase n=2 Tax=Microcoleus TaxID=44471 RepID=UPI002FD79FB1